MRTRSMFSVAGRCSPPRAWSRFLPLARRSQFRRVRRHMVDPGTAFVRPTAVKVLPGGDLLVLEKREHFPERVAANEPISPGRKYHDVR